MQKSLIIIDGCTNFGRIDYLSASEIIDMHHNQVQVEHILCNQNKIFDRLMALSIHLHNRFCFVYKNKHYMFIEQPVTKESILEFVDFFNRLFLQLKSISINLFTFFFFTFSSKSILVKLSNGLAKNDYFWYFLPNF